MLRFANSDKNEPTRQPIAMDVPAYAKFEIHIASRLRNSLSKIPIALECKGVSYAEPVIEKSALDPTR